MLRICDIRKTYKTGGFVQNALDGVSLTLRDSEFVAILGPSGSGKTTLLNIIGGLDRYDSGDLIINGISTKKYRDRDWDSYRNHTIGFVFQSYNLIPHQTVLANVELALTISGISPAVKRAKAVEALRKVGLADQINKKPGQMSGGQMQRVAIARALVNDPDIVLADEPTGALDSKTSVQVMELLKEISKDRLVVMVTHNPQLAQEYATRIVNLKDGRITDDSDPADMHEAAGVYCPICAEMDGYTDKAKAGHMEHGDGADDGAGDGNGGGEMLGASDKNAEHKKKKKASMSFLTALQLSFNNLWTKKARTIMVAAAGSIGIIGIALILSIANGVNQYIEDTEREALSEYPLQITKTGYDFTAMLETASSTGKSSNGDADVTDASADESSSSAKKTSCAGTKATSDAEGTESDAAAITNKNVRIYETITSMVSGFTSNDLASLKEYLESDECDIYKYASAIEYTYNITPQIYAYDEEDDEYNKVNPAKLTEENSFSSLFSSGTDSYFELPADKELYEQQYDIKAGHWPESSNELVLVLSRDGGISDLMLYALGLGDHDELEEMIKAAQEGKEYDVGSALTAQYTYDDFLGVTCKLVRSADYYIYDEELGIWVDKSGDSEYINKLAADGKELTVTGIVQPKADTDIAMLSTGIGYTHELTEQLMEYAQHSDIVAAQLSDDEINVLTGKKFTEQSAEDSFDLADLIDVDESKLQSLFNTDGIFGGVSMSDMTLDMSEILSDTDIADMIDKDALLSMLPSLSEDMLDQLLEGVETDFSYDNLSVLFEDLLEDYELYAKENDMPSAAEVAAVFMEYLESDEAAEILKEELQKILSERGDQVITKERLAQMAAQIIEGYNDYVSSHGLDESTQAENIMAYLASEEFGTLIEDIRDDLIKDLSDITISKEQAMAIAQALADGYKEYIEERNAPGPDALISSFEKYLDSSRAKSVIREGITRMVDIDRLSSNLETVLADLITSASQNMSEQMNVVLSEVTAQISKALAASVTDMMDSMSSGISGLLSADADTLGDIVSFDMSADEMQQLFSSLMSGTAAQTADSNLSAFGYANDSEPYSILIYPSDFDAKAQITEILDAYNQDMRDMGEEDKVITYTDIVGTMLSSVTTIVNVISYVLMAFVGISLVVSSIMIGVITFISVLERRKEIGILRAMGASKNNVANVFNAETFIIGFLAGVIGILVTLLLLIPINAIIHSITENVSVNASLPVAGGIVLILLSVGLTIIAGFIPARKAAKSDPVAALRSE